MTVCERDGRGGSVCDRERAGPWWPSEMARESRWEDDGRHLLLQAPSLKCGLRPKQHPLQSIGQRYWREHKKARCAHRKPWSRAATIGDKELLDEAMTWKSGQNLTAALNVCVWCLADCRKLALPDECRRPRDLESCSIEAHPAAGDSSYLHESYRLLTPGGLACHYVDNSDRWEHSDKSISQVDFLRFSGSLSVGPT